MRNLKNHPKRHDSSKLVSGIAGAIHHWLITRGCVDNSAVLFGLFTIWRQKYNTTSNRYLLSCFMLLIGGGMPSKCYAIASLDDTIKPYVAFNMLYDSNFLRVSNNVDPVIVIGESNKSEFLKQISAGFDIDRTISRQRIIIKANVNQNWFQNFTSLDYIGWNAQAQWNWQMRNNLNGKIGYINTEKLGSFDYLNRLIPNLINIQHSFANAEYLFHPNGKIKFGYFRRDKRFVDGNRQFNNNIEDNAELNLQFLSPTGSILGLRLLATDGQYPNRQFTAGDPRDNAYMRYNYALTWDWHASNKTYFDGFFGYTQQHFKHLSTRNFADIVGQLNLHWQASDKTLLELYALRNIYQSNSLFASFVLTNDVGFNLTWHYNPKIDMKLLTSYRQQQFLGNPTATDIVGFEQQKNHTGNIGFHLIYSLFDNISIDTVLNYEKRDSNNPLRSFETQSAGLNLKAAF
jgi:exopolysaccharide biosynthesis operon protein EpsL